MESAAAGRLAPGAPAIVERQAPNRPEAVAPHRYARVRCGDLHYEGWTAAELTAEHSVRWQMTYRVVRGQDVLAQHVASHDWWTVSAQDLRAEAVDAGLRVTEAGHSLRVLRA